MARLLVKGCIRAAPERAGEARVGTRHRLTRSCHGGLWLHRTLTSLDDGASRLNILQSLLFFEIQG
jgi:hypothetical protein